VTDSGVRLSPRLLGPTGLRVSELCLGGMTFGAEDGAWGADARESRRIFDVYREAGGNFVDTANRYMGGRSERVLGDIPRSGRDEIVLATKYTAGMRPGDPNSTGNHRKSLVGALDASLERLGTDYVDLLWVHAWDGITPIEETMRALDDVVRAGKVLYIGISDAPAWVVARANTLAELRGWTSFAAVQIEYSLIERTVERELVPMAQALGLSVLAWGPLGGGVLSGKYGNGANGSAAPQGRLGPGDRRLSDRNLAIAAELVDVARELELPPSQVALAWLRARRGADVIPIVGARTADQLREALGAIAVELPGDALARLDDATGISLGFPHDMLRALRRANAPRVKASP
jgi:aryl-alcohol dehydrogenase-like predicted oxidoreductase